MGVEIEGVDGIGRWGKRRSRRGEGEWELKMKELEQFFSIGA